MDNTVYIVIALIAIILMAHGGRIRDVEDRVAQLENPCQHLEVTDEFGECLDKTVQP